MADRISYTAGNFETIQNELFKKLKSLNGWNDLQESGTGSTLIRLFSYVCDLLLYKNNISLNENYLETSQIKENIFKKISMFNYIPRKATASHGILNLSLIQPNTVNIIIPKGTKFSTSSNITFYSPFDNEILPNETNIDIFVVQGKLSEMIFKSNGNELQSFLIESDNKDYYIGSDILYLNNQNYESIEVYVNNVKWTKVDSLINATSTDEVYQIQPLSDYAVKILFGDNKSGKIPPNNNTIKILTNFNIGKFGNINSEEIINILDSIKDSNDVTVSLTPYQIDSFLNGGDPETLESIKLNTPNYHKSGDRFVNDQDAKSIILNNFANILDIYVYAEEDKNPPNWREFSFVTFCILLSNIDGTPLLPSENNSNYNVYYSEIDNLLDEKKCITIRRKYIVPSPIKIYFKVIYKKYDNYTDNEIKSNIENTIQEYLIDNGKLSTIIKHSDIVKNIKNIEGINYCYVYMKKESDSDYSINNITTTETEYPVRGDGTYITFVKE